MATASAEDELYVELARGLTRGEGGTLIPLVERLVALEGSTERATVATAIVLMRELQFDDAEAVLRAWAKENSESPAIAMNLAKIRMEKGDEKGALALALKSVQAEPNQDNGLWWWASVTRRVVKTESAYRSALDEAAKLNGAWRVHLVIAELELEQGKEPAALEHFRKAIAAAAGQRAEALALSARRLMAMGSAEDVVALLKTYAPQTDGLSAGLMLLDAYKTLKRDADAASLLPKLRGLPGAARAPQIFEWEERLAQASLSSLDANKLTLRGLSLYAPLGKSAFAGAETWLLPKVAPGRAVAIACFTEMTAGEGAPGPVPASDLSTLARALPLALTAALRSAGVEAITLVPVVEGAGLPSPRLGLALEQLLPLLSPGHVPRVLIIGSFAQGLSDERQLELTVHDFAKGGKGTHSDRTFGKRSPELFAGAWKRLLRPLADAGVKLEGGARPTVSDGHLRALAAALPTFVLGAGLVESKNSWHVAGGLETCLAESLYAPAETPTQLLALATFLEGLRTQPTTFATFGQALVDLVSRPEAAAPLRQLAPLLFLRLGDRERFEASRKSLRASTNDAAYLAWLDGLK